jgi:glycosyltransferase involved in cell wall biosynthesis
VTGLLVPPNDLQEMRAALLSLTSAEHSRDLGRAARQLVLANHSADAMAKAYARIYQAAGRRAGRALAFDPVGT